MIRVLFGISLSAALIVGCCGQSERAELLKIWHAPGSPIEDRLAVVSKLVPKGTKIIEAERVLGLPARYERWHGAAADYSDLGVSTNGTRLMPGINPSGFINEERLCYEFPNGEVIWLRFDMLTAGDNFRAAPLVGFFSGRTNNLQIVPF